MDDDEACTEDASICRAGAFSVSGWMMGVCVDVGGSLGEKWCEIEGWCFGELEDDCVNVLENVGNFIVFIRISVEFLGILNKKGDGNLLWMNLNGIEFMMGWNLWILNDLFVSGGMCVEDIVKKGWDGCLDV